MGVDCEAEKNSSKSSISGIPKMSDCDPLIISGMGYMFHKLGSGYGSCGESQSSGISDSDDEVVHNRRRESSSGPEAYAHVYGQSLIDSYSLSSGNGAEQVIVEAFSFRPKSLSIACGTLVEFICLEDSSSTQLYCEKVCEGEESWDLIADPTMKSKLVHKFDNEGTFMVRNHIFSFMNCEIIVKAAQDAAHDRDQLLTSSAFVDDYSVRSAFY